MVICRRWKDPDISIAKNNKDFLLACFRKKQTGSTFCFVFIKKIKTLNILKMENNVKSHTGCHRYVTPSFSSKDLQIGSYLDQQPESCNSLCTAGSECCDEMAQCTCGTTNGHYACLCRKGFYGTGLRGDCHGEFALIQKIKGVRKLFDTLQTCETKIGWYI